MMTKRFRKKPVVITAEQFLSKDARPIPRGVCLGDGECMHDLHRGRWGAPHVTTIHGEHATVVPGDWIISEPDGVHFYPCKPDIFEATYEPID